MFREQSEGETAAARSRSFRKVPSYTAFVAITGASGCRLSYVIPEASVAAGLS